MKYRTVVADPPWRYDEGFLQGPTAGAGTVQIETPYPPMDIDEIAALPIPTLADRAAFLFLWTTNKYLPAALELTAFWGFRFRQLITWRKTGCPSPFVHAIAPQHSEFLLVSRRGTVKRSGAFPSTVIDAPAQSRHSQKPELFLDLIEAASPGPRLELFARRQRFGWDTWGLEALDHVRLEL